MNKYLELKELHTENYQQLNQKFKLISLIRLVVFLLFLFLGYKSFSKGNLEIIVGAVIALGCFIYLMRVHKRLSRKRKIASTLVEINEEEISFLGGKSIPFKNGEEYIDPSHFNSFDLDVFGASSLFQFLNRTATFPGSQKLAGLLHGLISNQEIIENQEAIDELSKDIEWRQDVLAYAKIADDSMSEYQKIISWAGSKSESFSTFYTILCYLGPLLFLITFIINFFRADLLFFHISTGFFIFNLFLAGIQTKRFKEELLDSDHITSVIQQYGLVIEKIESQKFHSKKLNTLQAKLLFSQGSASQQIKKLHTLYANVESVQNGFAAIFFNGSFLYHIHSLNALIKWKQKFAGNIEEWLEIVGEIEALSSLANYSYNNPAFVYPVLNSNLEIDFIELGHPLIHKDTRVCNDLRFQENNFIILTGSNMSGKSTFLRTLGINMVLAGVGAPVCASKADIHPLPVIVSMRQQDSLNDGESYFFAEVKRLKKIMDKLDEEICFVLLDEILKGTNSDDKQTGTIEVIKKVITKKAIGAIATHDLDVCKTTDEYPDQLSNKCFEVEIIDNDLYFDYTLREGVCKNKSATFIMKKEEII